MKQQITIKCRCGRVRNLELIGGQFQNSYIGDCICGRRWLLEDLTEDLTEELNFSLERSKAFKRSESTITRGV